MFTFDADTVSDLYKDVYGFRPSSYFWDKWNDSTDDQKQEAWDFLVDALAVENERARRYEELGLASFEKDIASAMSVTAPSSVCAGCGCTPRIAEFLAAAVRARGEE